MIKKLFGILLVIIALGVFTYLMFYTADYKPNKLVELPFVLESNKSKCVIFFGYVGCPEVCPVSLAKIAETSRKLNDNKLQVVFISLNNKSQAETEKFAKIFDSSFVGFKLSKDEQRELIERFNVFWSPERKIIKREAAHSPYIYFLKKEKEAWILKNVYTQYPAKVDDLITLTKEL